MKLGTGSQELTRLAAAYLASIAFGVTFLVASIGGGLGYAVQKSFRWHAESPKLFCSIIVLVPLAMGLENAMPPALPRQWVVSEGALVVTPPMVSGTVFLRLRHHATGAATIKCASVRGTATEDFSRVEEDIAAILALTIDAD